MPVDDEDTHWFLVIMNSCCDTLNSTSRHCHKTEYGFFSLFVGCVELTDLQLKPEALVSDILFENVYLCVCVCVCVSVSVSPHTCV